MRRCDQVEVFIAQYAQVHGGNFPTNQEIADAVGTGRGNAHKWVRDLVAKGRVIVRDGKCWIADSIYSPPERLKRLVEEMTFTSNATASAAQRQGEVRALYKSQKGNCWWCNDPLLGIYHIDHRVPLSRGGPDTLANLCLSCPECNLKKSDKMPWEFNGRLL